MMIFRFEVAIMDTKKCTKCGNVLSLYCFHYKGDRLHPACKLCRKEDDRKYYKKNAKSIRKNKKEYSDKHPKARLAKAIVRGAIKNGKLAKEKSWVPIRKRNDAIDTTAMAIVLSEKDKVSLMRQTSSENIKEVLGSITVF